MVPSSFLHEHLYRFGVGLAVSLFYCASRILLYERIGFFKHLDSFNRAVLRRVGILTRAR